MKKLIYLFRYSYAKLEYWYAVRKADNLHKTYKERFYVMPNEDDKLIVFNRKSFRKYKNKGRITYEAHVDDMIRECFYFTPNRAELDAITPEIAEAKKLMWFEYYFKK